MKIHPLADLIPLMTTEEYGELRDSIAANGLRVAITLYEGAVLDGRHRLRACQELGVEPRFTDYDGGEPASFVIDLNVHRRDLTTGQLTAVAVDFLPALEDEARARQGKRTDLTSVSPDTEVDAQGGERSYGVAAAKVGVSSASVGRGKRVKRDAPDLWADVKSGDKTVTTAHRELKKRLDPDAEEVRPAFEITSDRHRQLATRAKERVWAVVSGLDGYAEGVEGGKLRVDRALAVADSDEIQEWVRILNRSTRALGRLSKSLKEEVANGKA